MSSWVDQRPEMSREERHELADLFQASSGFVLREDMKFVAERRLAARLEVLGLRDFSAYARYLKFDAQGAEELETAIDLLVPHETYFFRESAQLEAFVDDIIPSVLRQHSARRPLQIWSAGCSTGEEPYTISMLLSSVKELAGHALEVWGTDLSRRALTTARKAEYGASSLRSTNEEQRRRYFDPLTQDRVVVKPLMREWVRFGQLNLLDGTSTALLPTFDVIFCRNVLMYFDVSTRKRVVDRFYEQLSPGGFLLLGHSENLLTLSTRFELVQLQKDLVYRRPA